MELKRLDRRLKRLTFSREIMRRGVLTPQVIMAMFEALPRDFKIVDFGYDAMSDCGFWVAHSEEFEEVAEGSIIPEDNLEFTEEGGYLRCRVKS